MAEGTVQKLGNILLKRQEGGEVVKSMAALAEDLGLVPSTHVVAVSDSNSREPNALFWSPWALIAHVADQISIHKTLKANKHNHFFKKKSVSLLLIISLVKSANVGVRAE